MLGVGEGWAGAPGRVPGSLVSSRFSNIQHSRKRSTSAVHRLLHSVVGNVHICFVHEYVCVNIYACMDTCTPICTHIHLYTQTVLLNCLQINRSHGDSSKSFSEHYLSSRTFRAAVSVREL